MKSPFKRRGLLLVLSSPSGAGKTTITRALLDNNTNLKLSLSYTTRPMRPGESDGVHYNFVDVPTFQAMIDDNSLLEYAKVFGNYYGTPFQPVQDALAESEDIVFDIDWQGTQQLKQRLQNDLVTVFILPPSKAELANRLRGRSQDDGAIIAARMAESSAEISHYSEYDYIVVNYDLTDSIRQVQAILDAERCKRRRLTDLPDFVRKLMDQE
ncbi:MAG: guanylate kinase [Pseudomonadota bacterium]